MSWFNFIWTRKDKELLIEWISRRGKDIPIIDEIKDIELSDNYTPIPKIVESQVRDYISAYKIKPKKGYKGAKRTPEILIPSDRRKKRVPISRITKEEIINERGTDCEDCKKTEFDHWHHINGDRSNSEKSNIRILCYRCHKAADKALYEQGILKRGRNRNV